MDKGAICYRRYLDGDKSGLEELVEMYNSSLIFYINGFVNNISVSEDIAADTFVELIVRKSRFKNDYMFKTWLYRIARNNTIDYLRKQSKRQTKPIGDSHIILVLFILTLIAVGIAVTKRETPLTNRSLEKYIKGCVLIENLPEQIHESEKCLGNPFVNWHNYDSFCGM